MLGQMLDTLSCHHLCYWTATRSAGRPRGKWAITFFRQWQFSFIRLDGTTPPAIRPDLVREFNGNPAIQCFLISTKAGGTGLNLTGADTVIFYDHDWNPANDSQAQDRAYRIGQTKPVTVYRLISQGTIEEKILTTGVETNPGR